MKFFEVFKAGNYPQGKFTKAEVEELAKNYDPSFCEAPITLDHEQKGPAYGWVENLKEDGGVLKATFKDLSDDLKEFVNQGKYKKISIEIYRELEGKKPYLKAVSFLGASIPQVKGMKAVEFKDGESDTYIFETVIEDSEEDEDTEVLKATINDLTKQVADFKEKAKKNTEIKDFLTIFKEMFSDKNFREVVRPFFTKSEILEKEGNSQVKDLTIQLAKFRDDAAGKDELAKELKDIKENLRTKDFNEFIDKQIETGTLTPAQKDAVFSILCDLDNVKKFDEASNSIEDFKTLITAMPKQIEFSEVATKRKSTTKVDEEKYADADEESVEIYKQAKALAKKENISFKDALLKIKEI